jgi:hypothetical protein
VILIRLVIGEGTRESHRVLRCVLYVPCLEYFGAIKSPSIICMTDDTNRRTPLTVSRESLSTMEAADLRDFAGAPLA